MRNDPCSDASEFNLAPIFVSYSDADISLPHKWSVKELLLHNRRVIERGCEYDYLLRFVRPTFSDI